MYKPISILAALALAAAAGAANAAETSGTLQSFDAASRTIVLEDNSAFSLDEGIMTEGLEAGVQVTVRYEEREGRNVATSVELNK